MPYDEDFGIHRFEKINEHNVKAVGWKKPKAVVANVSDVQEVGSIERVSNVNNGLKGWMCG